MWLYLSGLHLSRHYSMPKLRPIPVNYYNDTTTTERLNQSLKPLLDLKQMQLQGSTSEQINSLNKAITKLNRAYAWLSNRDNRPTGSLFPYNMRTAATEVNDVLKVLKPKLAAAEDLRQKQVNFANRTVLPNDTGVYAGNGKFYIQFVNVGMGDCTLITTPKGVKIMIDCGSHALKDVTSLIPGYDPAVNGSAEKIVGNAIQSKTFLNGSGAIDILVLTHKDPDHHNKLEPILKDTIGGSISVKIVYFGGADDLVAFTGSSAYIKDIAGLCLCPL